MTQHKLGKKVTMINDIRDFKMPYAIYGTQDLNNMISRYMQLSKVSRPTYQRLGFFHKSL